MIKMESASNDKKVTFDYLSNVINNLDTVLQDLGTITDIRKNQSQNIEDIIVLEMLNTIINSFDYEITKIEAIITVNISSYDTVLGIKSFIYSILINLMSNAIKYRNPELKLKITFGFETN
ncbi:MAG: two-component system, sensor histidine kinase LadS [Mucilaginibacter sp.]|nr:two-component system, sensor histidine kinase LadS [Mucilaginibacter sp.]